MFGGSAEILVILVVALVVVGPARLPDLIRGFGKALSEFRRMSSDVKATLEREIERAEEIKRIDEIKKELFDEVDKTKESLGDVAQTVTGQADAIAEAEQSPHNDPGAAQAGLEHGDALQTGSTLSAAGHDVSGQPAGEHDPASQTVASHPPAEQATVEPAPAGENHSRPDPAGAGEAPKVWATSPAQHSTADPSQPGPAADREDKPHA